MDSNCEKKEAEAAELTHEEIWDDSLLIKQYDEKMGKARVALANTLPASASSATDTEQSHNHRAEIVNHTTHSHGYSHVQRKRKHKGRKKNEWQTGDPCRSKYSEDAIVYEATILGMNQTNGQCTVRYIGFDNYEDVAVSSLLKSNGDAARKKQVYEAQPIYSESEDTADESSALSDAPMDEDRTGNPQKSSYFSSMMPPPEVPPHRRQNNHSIPHLPNLPPPPALGLVDDGDSVSSEALHTMLMSWYMTGYHTGYYQGISSAKRETKAAAELYTKGKRHHNRNT